MIVLRGKDHHNGTQTRPFVSLPERLPRPSTLPCGRRTDARLGTVWWLPTLERRAHPTSSFSELPTSNHATLSKYQV
ncbi:hypothetical protein [Aneurinibacillus migulanus]|uniref:hypothetical protein n=1 Tax=Aneurinibacillus migulanus TaxID=47500 RepID=UPI001F172302|nr:hypothetical protein [Aneurinibacillus migulanus]